METFHNGAALRAWLESRRGSGRVGLVPTMGALHQGHLSLIQLARERGARTVVASIFVNPTQFGAGEDLERYPRTPAEDSLALASVGCDAVFCPTVDDVYPADFATYLDPLGPAIGLEGAARPGHFRGVATVVARLFALVRPNLAVFGRKDAQQLAVVQRLVADLGLGVEIVPGPIVREADGLAMSSRNRYLDPQQRRAATALSRALAASRSAILAGERRADALQAQLLVDLTREPLVAAVDYAAVVEASSFQPLERLAGEVVIAIAVRIGTTRLLDNLVCTLSGGQPCFAP